MKLKYEYGLPNHLEGKSFADASKSIEKKFKERLSPIDIRTKQELMSRLKDMQEIKRQEVEKTNSNQFANGGDETDEFTGNELHNETLIPYTEQNWMQRTFTNPDSWFNRSFGKDTFLGKHSDSILGGLGLAASALGPLLANRRAMKSLYKPETLKANLMDEGQYQPLLVNRQQLLRNASEQSATQRYLMNQMGGDWAQRSAMFSNIAANKLNTTGNLMLQADIADQGERARIQGLKSNVQQFNIGQQDRVAEINQQNLANYYNTMAAYQQAQGANIGAIGQSLFNLMQAKKYGKQMQYTGTLKGV